MKLQSPVVFAALCFLRWNNNRFRIIVLIILLVDVRYDLKGQPNYSTKIDSIAAGLIETVPLKGSAAASSNDYLIPAIETVGANIFV
ncbi:MAG: hypothetical protein Q8O74_03650, partial [bacterium]|nr:hypothetical protein [bacterium]